MLRQFPMKTIVAWLALGILMPTLSADDTKKSDATKADARTKKLYEAFEKRMKNVKLVGQFTILGRASDKLAKEEYTIRSVKKLPQGDMWAFATHVKYGNINLPITMNLPVKWAGDTPVISLTDLKIPTLGTFSARVVLYNKKYAGTWTHGKVGGHLFGTIQKAEAAAPAENK